MITYGHISEVPKSAAVERDRIARRLWAQHGRRWIRNKYLTSNSWGTFEKFVRCMARAEFHEFAPFLEVAGLDWHQSMLKLNRAVAKQLEESVRTYAH